MANLLQMYVFDYIGYTTWADDYQNARYFFLKIAILLT